MSADRDALTTDIDFVDGIEFRSAAVPFTASTAQGPQAGRAQAPLTGPTPLLSKNLGNKWISVPFDEALYQKGCHVAHYWEQPIKEWLVGKITQVRLRLPTAVGRQS